MNYIYTITAITEDGKDSRCFGFYFSEASARLAALNNYGSMDECLYDYLVIERQKEGIHSFANVLQWYVWEHPDGEMGYWVIGEQPVGKRFEGITNWNGIG